MSDICVIFTWVYVPLLKLSTQRKCLLDQHIHVLFIVAVTRSCSDNVAVFVGEKGSKTGEIALFSDRCLWTRDV